jgi:hypothetical protein
MGSRVLRSKILFEYETVIFDIEIEEKFATQFIQNSMKRDWDRNSNSWAHLKVKSVDSSKSWKRKFTGPDPEI